MYGPSCAWHCFTSFFLFRTDRGDLTTIFSFISCTDSTLPRAPWYFHPVCHTPRGLSIRTLYSVFLCVLCTLCSDFGRSPSAPPLLRQPGMFSHVLAAQTARPLGPVTSVGRFMRPPGKHSRRQVQRLRGRFYRHLKGTYGHDLAALRRSGWRDPRLHANGSTCWG